MSERQWHASYEPTGAGAETKSFCPCQKKSGIASAVPDFFVSERKDLAARFARRPTCGACRGALAASGGQRRPSRQARPSPSCDFRHVMVEAASPSRPFSWFSHPASSVSNRCTPLQHPKRTRFRLFLAESGAFSFSRCFSGAKFLDWFLCILPYSDHRLKPSVIPCRREDPPRCVQPAYCNSPCLCYTEKSETGSQ